MKLSTRTRYGTRALLELTLHNGEGPVSLKDIAKRQEISLAYLEHLIAPLVAAGIIRSTKGPRGGVSLARDPSTIKLSEVTQLLEGSMAPVECVNDPDVCNRSGICATRDTWIELNTVMQTVLDSTTLRDLADRQRRKEKTDAEMYYI